MAANESMVAKKAQAGFRSVLVDIGADVASYRLIMRKDGGEGRYKREVQRWQ